MEKSEKKLQTCKRIIKSDKLIKKKKNKSERKCKKSKNLSKNKK